VAFQGALDTSKQVFHDNADIYDGEWEDAKDNFGDDFALVNDQIEESFHMY